MGRKIINDDKLKDLLKQGKSYRKIGKELGVSAVAICNRIKRLGLLALPKSLENLTHKEQKFALAMAEGKSRISAVMETYDVTSRESAKALQNTLMKNPEIRIAIDDLMEIKGIGRGFRIDKLGEHMKSHDPVISLKALDMGFKLSGDEAEGKRDIKKDANLDFIDVDPIVFEFEYGNKPDKFKKIAGRCALCEKEGGEINDICLPCREKYSDITDKLTRYWAGDECAICKSDKRCYDYCKACKERKEVINHV